jgi:hypothetical protein
MLVGAYYPWLDYKWGGFVTSVPIKNPEITDVFSQIYLWKNLIIDSLKSFQLPLWNQFSYSGYPLLANFQSGVFNPLNILMLIFNPLTGWSLLIFSQFVLSSIFMYLFLLKIHKNIYSSIVGALVYSFSGFLTIWSQFATAGFAMIWLPLIFLSIYNYFETKKIIFLLYLSPLYFLLMTSGHFQALIFGCLFSGFYFLWKLYISKNIKPVSLLAFFVSVVIGIGLMTVQLFPTIELSKLSVRFSENYISHFNYGLLSLNRIITLFAPDYFGNPNTMNFWGSFNYYETIIYCGAISIFSLVFAIHNRKKLKEEIFFLFFLVVSLLISFDTPLGRFIYEIKTPGLSTSAAGRINMILVFCMAILCSFLIKNINLHTFKNTIKYYWIYLLIIISSIIYTYTQSKTVHINSQNYMVAFRNMAIPLVLSICIFLVLLLIRNKKIKTLLLLLITIADFVRFGSKYTPFVNKEYVFPKTDVTTFLQNQPGIFRIEKEKGPLLTPNTWTAYDLSSPSGYDPMAVGNYSIFFQKYLNGRLNVTNTSRYSEINEYDAEKLGEANVKYLLALKYDKIDEISPEGDHYNYKINLDDWQKVYEYGSVAVLENQKFKPRIEISNPEDQKSLNNIFYSANKISFDINSTQENSTLILRDTWYPGWRAYINDIEVPIDKYLNIYRQIIIPKGESKIKFIYHPKSFYYGFYISSFAFIVWLIFIIKFNNKKV